jgi:hypothetical protein
MSKIILSKEELPIQFTKKELEKFKMLYFKHFNLKLTEDEAYDKANRIFQAIKASAKPLPKDGKIKT